jgi:hypothetical protein
VLELARAGEQTPSALVCAYPLTTVQEWGVAMEDAADARPLNLDPPSVLV